MLFSVIYSVDVPEGISLRRFTPPNVRELWERTEGDEQYEYGHLEGRWTKGRHRKWAALLDRTQFDEFVKKVRLYAESTETMGAIGAPEMGFGWSPAISFTSNTEEAILTAYVTPIPETSKQGGDNRDWNRVKNAVLSVYAA